MVKPDSGRKCRAVVMGASAGGGEAIRKIVSALPKDYGFPVLIVQHLHHNDNGMFAHGLRQSTKLKVNIPCDKDEIKAGEIFVAPANYHLLVETDETIALSVEEKINFSRPSIDVFLRARHTYGGPW